MRLELTFWQRLRIGSALRRDWYLALAKLSKEGIPIYESLKLMHQEFHRLQHPLLPLTALVLLGLRISTQSLKSQQGRLAFLWASSRTQF